MDGVDGMDAMDGQHRAENTERALFRLCGVAPLQFDPVEFRWS